MGGKTVKVLSISEVGRLLGANPRHISTAFYCRKLDDNRCPIVGGRRIIPEDYLPEIEAVLRKAGQLPEQVSA
jgi:hypothetical protein